MIRHNASYPESPRAEDWRDFAACRETDSELFFASEQTGEGRAAIVQARAICFRCPSMDACGQWAYENQEPVGVWGGVTESERRARLRRRGIKLPAPETAEATA